MRRQFDTVIIFIAMILAATLLGYCALQNNCDRGATKGSAAHAERRPVDSNAPLFKISATTLKGDVFSTESKEPLLVVSSLADLTLDPDGKSVLIRLNERDARIFAELTKKIQGGYLLIECTDTIPQPIRILTPVEDGQIQFRYPYAELAAEYFRKRFRIGEFE
jgi:hypothetical protein